MAHDVGHGRSGHRPYALGVRSSAWLLLSFAGSVGCGDLPSVGRTPFDGAPPADGAALDVADTGCEVVLLEDEPRYWQGAEIVLTRSGVLTMAPDATLTLGGLRLVVGAKSCLLTPLVGEDVEIRGKMVDVGRGRELWAGALLRRCD